jgi:UDP-hydrolysing UDP-N-acetyl-D-glucosamine 2-epimerase
VYGRRIEQLGEEPWRITVSGAPALDAIREVEPMTDDELAKRGIRLRGPTLLVTFHPVTLELDQTEEHVDAVLAAVDASGLDAVMTYPNADAGHTLIIERLERLGASSPRFNVVPSLGADTYYAVMSRISTVVGNSSSGIIEAASFRVPVVDVGNRQRGRIRGPNVIHAEPETTAIGEALARALSDEFRSSLATLVNPYGDGYASSRIADVVTSVPLDGHLLTKRFHDV